MARIVIDTNIWISVLTTRSEFHHILLDLRKGRYELAVSTEILFEYEEIIKIKYGRETAETFLNILDLLPNVHFIHPTFRWGIIIADPEDNKFVDTAVASGSDYIVTEDNHYKIVKTSDFPVVKVIKLKKFSELLRTNNL
jgi:uncharacterized protein